jgi:hypothetical protein
MFTFGEILSWVEIKKDDENKTGMIFAMKFTQHEVERKNLFILDSMKVFGYPSV